MHLRLPLVIGIVVVAASVAGFRASHGVWERHAPAVVTPAADNPRAGKHAPKATVTVYVAGEVLRSGVYVLPAASRAVDALHAAGGATAAADLVATNLAEALSDGEEVALFAKDAAGSARAALRSHRPRRAAAGHPGTTDASRTGRAASRTHRKKKRRRPPASDAAAADVALDAPSDIVDLNAADESELETLPGIGAGLAARIVSFREQTGRFSTPDDLLDVGGMTEGKLDAVAPYVTTR